MIPIYPEFKKLELTDKNDVNKIVSKFPPYSDFNFVSMYSYNVRNFAQLSILNNNLVVKFEDYIDNEPFYTFLGNIKSENTIEELLKRSVREGIKPQLKLVPETSIENIKDAHFKIAKDQNSFDYILSIEDMANLKGYKFYSHLKLIHQFKKMYPNAVFTKIDLKDRKICDEIENLFTTWSEQKHRIEHDFENEFEATKRLLQAAPKLDLISTAVYDGDKMLVYLIEEIIHDKYVMAHFEKADGNYRGVYQFMANESAKHLKSLGGILLNYEQDLGLPGLKLTKQLWHPVAFLKKYIVS